MPELLVQSISRHPSPLPYPSQSANEGSRSPDAKTASLDFISSAGATHAAASLSRLRLISARAVRMTGTRE